MITRGFDVQDSSSLNIFPIELFLPLEFSKFQKYLLLFSPCSYKVAGVRIIARAFSDNNLKLIFLGTIFA